MKKIEEKENLKNTLFSHNADDAFKRLQILVEKLGVTLLESSWLGRENKHRIALSNGLQINITPKKLQENGLPLEYKIYEKKTEVIKDHTFYKMQEVIQKNGGILKSDKYFGANHQYEFIDHMGQSFQATAKKVANGWWNQPGYGFFIGEEFCRNALEHLTQLPFKKTRKILTPEINGTKNFWELDGYNEQLSLAFEYQGHASHWDTKHKDYPIISQRDKLKKQLCEQLDIKLVVIHHINKLTPKNLKTSFDNICQELQTLAPQLTLNQKPFSYNRPSSKNHPNLKILADIALKNGGKLLDKDYYGPYHKYKFEFSNGLKFEKMGYMLIKKGWPSSQYYLKKLSNKEKDIYETKDNNIKNIRLTHFKNLLKQHNCSLIDNDWYGFYHIYNIKTSCGSTIQVSAQKLYENINHIKINPTKNNSTHLERFQELKNIVHLHNATLLEPSWLGYDTPHRIAFADGREFLRSPKAIKEKGFPVNAEQYLKRQQSQIRSDEDKFQELKNTVQLHNATLLESSWLGSKTPHRMAFADGREFLRSPKAIKEKGFPLDADSYFKRQSIQKTKKQLL